MRSTINHLIQLQELILIRDEHRALSEGEHLDRLNDSIDELTRGLPAPVRGVYNRLQKRDHMVAAPVNGDACSVCGMKLPISLIQAIRREEQIQHCPSCARVLFWSGVPRSTVETNSRLGPRKVGVSRFSHKSLMVPELSATTRDAAIEELASQMRECGFVSDESKLVDFALDREAILSTAVDYNLAFPHVRGVEGGGLTMALGVSHQGIAWGAPNGELTHFVFFFAIPTAVSAFYLKLLSGLTESFVKEENRQALLEADSTQQVWKALTKATRYTVR